MNRLVAHFFVIATLMLILALVAPVAPIVSVVSVVSVAFAQEDTDIRGGIFDDDVRKGFFDDTPVVEKSPSSNDSANDSWTVDIENLEEERRKFIKQVEKETKQKEHELQGEIDSIKEQTESKKDSKPEDFNPRNPNAIIQNTTNIIEKVKRTPTNSLQHRNRGEHIKKVISSRPDVKKKRAAPTNVLDSSSEQKTTGSEKGPKDPFHASILPTTIFPEHLEPDPKATLNLVVAAKPAGHALKHIERLAEVKKRYGITIGQVAIVGADKSFPFFSTPIKGTPKRIKNPGPKGRALQLKKMGVQSSPLQRAIKKLGLTQKSTGNTADELLTRLKTSSSPTWIVRFQGNDYVFEGGFHPREFFNKRGYFIKTGETKPRLTADGNNISLFDQKTPVISARKSGGGVRFPGPVTAPVPDIHVPKEMIGEVGVPAEIRGAIPKGKTPKDLLKTISVPKEFSEAMPNKQATEDFKDTFAIPKEALQSKPARSLLLLESKYVPRSSVTKRIPTSLSRLPKLNRCKTSNVYRKQVYQYSMATDYLDALYFSPDDRAQEERAKEYRGNKVIYTQNATFDIMQGKDNPYPFIGLMLGVRCLPTRFHYVNVNGKRFMEYREGEAAWTDIEKDPPIQTQTKTPQPKNVRKPPKRSSRNGLGSF